MATLHIHLDESGCWGFHQKGSRYLILTATWTFDPRPLAETLTNLRFSLLRNGHSIESFHAAPDKQATRDSVVAAMMSRADWHFASVVLEKRRINPTLRDPGRFYPTFAGTLLRFILRGGAGRSATRALIYADTIPLSTHAKREGVVKAIKTVCKAELSPGCSHHAFSHCHESNTWIQVTDYCGWAVQRKWERGDARTYDLVCPRMPRPELEVTAAGDGTTYY